MLVLSYHDDHKMEVICFDGVSKARLQSRHICIDAFVVPMSTVAVLLSRQFV